MLCVYSSKDMIMRRDDGARKRAECGVRNFSCHIASVPTCKLWVVQYLQLQCPDMLASFYVWDIHQKVLWDTGRQEPGMEDKPNPHFRVFAGTASGGFD